MKNHVWYKLTLLFISFLLLNLIQSPLVCAQNDSATVTGIISDKRDFPMENITIELLNIDSGEYNITSLSDKDGFFRFNNLSSGNYTLSYYVYGKHYYQTNFTLEPEAVTWVNITYSGIYPKNNDNDNEGPGEDGKACDEEDGSNASCLIYLILSIVVILVIIVVVVAQFSRIRRNELLEQENRQIINKHILDNPGRHFRAIKKDLKLTTGVLSYHLDRLEKERFVTSRKEGKYKRFYPPNWNKAPGMNLTITQKSILQHIKNNPGVTQSKLAENIGRNKKAVNYNVHQLRELGLLYLEKRGRNTKCYYVPISE